jgi:small-conductance mechanosensitive channel
MESTPTRQARPEVVRAVLAIGVVAIAVVVGRSRGQLREVSVTEGVVDPVELQEGVIAACALVAIIVGGVFAVRYLGHAVRIVMEQNAAGKHVAPLNLLIAFIGYIAVAVGVLVVLRQPVGGILLGGALTGVLIGIAAQQVLANFFAGIVLLIVRPFAIADEIVLKSGPLGGEYEGLVTDMGLFYVKLQTHTGPVSLPNAGVLASAVGPGVRAAEERPEDEQQDAARE